MNHPQQESNKHIFEVESSQDLHSIICGIALVEGVENVRDIRDEVSTERTNLLNEVRELVESGKGRETGVWHYEINDANEMEASYMGEYISIKELLSALTKLQEK